MPPPTLPEKYLIGPKLYPAFSMIMRIVLSIVAAVSLFGLIVAVNKTGPTFGDYLAAVAGQLAEFAVSAVMALGNVVLIFAILQWALPDVKVKVKQWDPLALKAVRDRDRIKIGELLFDTAATIGAILLFNFLPQYVGSFARSWGEWSHTSLLTPAFFEYLPWLNGIWVLAILLNIFVLRRGRWQTATHWLAVARSLFGIVILVAMASGEPVFQLYSVDVSQILWVIILVIGIGLARRLNSILKGATL